jgi:hypothetical protein
MRIPSPPAITARASALLLCAASLDPELHGKPCSPAVPSDAVLIRYMHDGGTLSQGRLCTVVPVDDAVVTGVEVLAALQSDGVDLKRFYACAYWHEDIDSSTGAWLPLLPELTDAHNLERQEWQEVEIELVPQTDGGTDTDSCMVPARKRAWSHAPKGAPRRRRVDIKLFRRDEDSIDTRVAAGPGAGELGVGGCAARFRAVAGFASESDRPHSDPLSDGLTPAIIGTRSTGSLIASGSVGVLVEHG